MVERLQQILERRWLSNHGPVVLEFEKRLSEVTQTKHCIALCNGTIALEIAIRADFAVSIDENAVHGSDSEASAAREIAYFFAATEVCARIR